MAFFGKDDNLFRINRTTRDNARDYKTYLRHNGKPYAWLRAVVSNRPDRRGGRPFFPIRDEDVTLACRIRKRGGEWSRPVRLVVKG